MPRHRVTANREGGHGRYDVVAFDGKRVLVGHASEPEAA